MTFHWQSFGAPKRGNSASEYEDACAANPKAGRFAIADGASESSFAALWARLLVERFTHLPPKRSARTDWLTPLQQRWSSEVDKLELPWYAEAKRELGASATFLGLVLKRSVDRRSGIWLARAVGDCCIFQIHNERLVKAFPLTCSSEFCDRPNLLNSKPERNQSHQQALKEIRSRWCVGDRFLMMTDAIAQWFLSRHEQAGKPWQEIARMLPDGMPDKAFDSWIEKLRTQSDLRNDDVTLVAIDP
jgi:hypothetical protein